MSKSSKFEEFGNLLREARETLGMTQEQLRAELGCSGPMIERWESGENIPSEKYSLKINSILGVNANEYQKHELKIGDSDFCKFLYKLRSATCLSRSAFAKKINGSDRLNEWEGGRSLPNIRIIERIEKVFSEFQETEYIRIAWELELDRLPEMEATKLRTFKQERAYHRHTDSVDVKPIEEKTVNTTAKVPAPVEVIVSENYSDTVIKKVRTVHVCIDRIINRAGKAGYGSSSTSRIKEFLQVFAEVIVGETFNHLENRSYREIPWPLPPDINDKRPVYIYQDGQEMVFTDDILEFGWKSYLEKHGLEAKVTCEKSDESGDGFFRN